MSGYVEGFESLEHSTSANACKEVIDRLLEKLQPSLTLTEILKSRDAPTGYLRVWQNEKVKIVNIGLIVPFIGLDSHMVFAFSPNGSAVPHFTLDSVKSPNGYAYHLDLIPKVDLAINVRYMEECYVPLEETINKVKEIEGLTPAHLNKMQYTVLSPWMLTNRCADEECFLKLQPHINAYLDQWFKLLENNFDYIDKGKIDERDAAHRAVLFSYVDPVWKNVDRLVGVCQNPRHEHHQE